MPRSCNTTAPVPASAVPVVALVIDGTANASAFLVELAGDLLRFFTTGNVRNYALGFSLGVAVLLVYVWVR